MKLPCTAILMLCQTINFFKPFHFLTNKLIHMTAKTIQHDFHFHTFWKHFYQVAWLKDIEIIRIILIP